MKSLRGLGEPDCGLYSLTGPFADLAILDRDIGDFVG